MPRLTYAHRCAAVFVLTAGALGALGSLAWDALRGRLAGG